MIYDDLQKESEKDSKITEDWSGNILKKTISELFSTELSGEKYKQYSVVNLKLLIEEKFSVLKGTRHYTHGLTLLTNIKKRASIVDILKILEEALFN